MGGLSASHQRPHARLAGSSLVVGIINVLLAAGTDIVEENVQVQSFAVVYVCDLA